MRQILFSHEQAFVATYLNPDAGMLKKNEIGKERETRSYSYMELTKKNIDFMEVVRKTVFTRGLNYSWVSESEEMLFGDR